jgi:hypothetical protein
LLFSGGGRSFGKLGAWPPVHGPSFLPQSLALFAAMTTPPTTARKILINNTIGALLSAGIWSQLDVLYVLAAADNQAARLNWINPSTFMALPVNAPTFTTDRGYTGDGSSSRLRTQYTPSVNGVAFTLNSASAWGWFLTNQQGSSRDIGNASVNPTVGLLAKNTSNLMAGAINDSTSALTGAATVPTAIGFCGIQRVGSANRTLWKNGISLGSVAAASVGLPTQEQWICGANSTNFSSQQIAAAAWGAAIPGLEPAFYTSCLLPYMQAVGAA